MFLGGTRAAALALVIIGIVASAASAAGPSIHVLSDRADVISGGDALVAIDPAPATVTLDGRDVSDSFALRPNGEFEGLVTGLANGANVLTATLSDGTSDSATITNHPIGGPVFTGPQIQPWACQTGALDAQCNAPTQVSYQYKIGRAHV